jgi:hypothetical protein
MYYLSDPRWREETTMTPDRCMIFMTLIILLALLAVPSSATPIPVAIKGTVIALDETNQTLTLRAECQRYPCQYNLTGTFFGRVPNAVLFSRVNEGDVVEAVFKDWIFRVTDPSTGYIVPLDETRDLRQWYTIQRLACEPGTDTLVATELFGDPSVSRVPFQGGYTIDYRLFGPSPTQYDFQSFPPQTIANISVRRETGLNQSAILATGESFSIPDSRDGMALTMQFIGGYDAGLMAGKACPCASFHIRVLPGNGSGPVPLQETPATGTPVKSSWGSLTPVVVMTAFAVVSRLVKT